MSFADIEHIRYCVLAKAPMVLSLLFHLIIFGLVAIWEMNSMQVSLTNEIFRFGNGIFKI